MVSFNNYVVASFGSIANEAIDHCNNGITGNKFRLL